VNRRSFLAASGGRPTGGTGQAVRMALGGHHIMLMGLKQMLIAGTIFPVTLTFANAGQVPTTVIVQKVAAAMPMDHGQGDMERMPGMRGR
jgi:copper(I)-binding protein